MVFGDGRVDVWNTYNVGLAIVCTDYCLIYQGQRRERNPYLRSSFRHVGHSLCFVGLL